MTSIAYRDGIMASDSLATRGWYVSGKSQKVHKFKSDKQQVLIGAAGTVTSHHEAFEFLKKSFDEKGLLPRRLPFKLEDATILAVIQNKKGKEVFWEWNNSAYAAHDISYNGLCSIGSGYLVCLAAMLAGATAVGAIKIASKLDTGTGGRIQTVQFD